MSFELVRYIVLLIIRIMNRPVSKSVLGYR